MPNDGKPAAFDCQTCLATTAQAVRGSLHCGWMAPEEWPAAPAELPPAFGPNRYEVDVCPGWVVRQPSVGEACEAYAALEAGALGVAFPDLTQEQWEAAMALRSAWEARKAELMQPKEQPDGAR